MLKIKIDYWTIWLTTLCCAVAAMLSPSSFAGDDSHLRGFNVKMSELVECYNNRSHDCIDLQQAQIAGATLVRLDFSKLPLIQQQPPYAINHANLDELERTVTIASELGLRVVVDPHAVPGAARHTTLGASDAFWTDPNAQNALVTLWKEITRRIKRIDTTDTVYAFDLINEPYDVPASASLNAIYRRLVRAIRNIDADQHLILDFQNQHYWDDPRNLATFRPQPPIYYEPTDRGRQGNENGRGRILYSTHIYWPLDFTHQGITVTRGDGSLFARAAGRRWNVSTTTSNALPWTQDGLARRLGGVKRFADTHGHWRMFIGEFSASACADCAWDSRLVWERPGNGGDRWLSDVTGLLDAYQWDWTYHALNGTDFWNAATPKLRWGHIGYLLNR